jgi:hypothetical protein
VRSLERRLEHLERLVEGCVEDSVVLCPKPCKGPITMSQRRLMVDGSVEVPLPYRTTRAGLFPRTCSTQEPNTSATGGSWTPLTTCGRPRQFWRKVLSSSSQVANRPADLFTPYRLPMVDPEARVAGHSILAAYRASKQDAPNSPANRRFLGPCPPALESRACLHVPVNGGGESPEASSNGRAPPSERSRPCVTKEARSLDRM